MNLKECSNSSNQITPLNKNPVSKQKLSISYGGETNGTLTRYGSLGDLLHAVARDQADNGITFVESKTSELFCSYSMLYQQAQQMLCSLQRAGLQQGDIALLSYRKNSNFVIAFWACILGGITPSPVAYPTSLSNKNDSVRKIFNIARLLSQPYFLTDSNISLSNSEIEAVFGLNPQRIILTPEFKLNKEPPKAVTIGPDDPAFIQYSSGSTGNPKGVVLTHHNLLINLEGIIAGLEGTPEDTYLSWMPYHHDMGLIGFHLTPLAQRVNQINLSPIRFIQRPLLWIEKIDEHRATITSSPNFGYAHFLEKYTEKAGKGWDLSCLRLIFNGAEPISAQVMRDFMAALKPCKLSPSAMFPVYGMAEASLALTFPKVNEEPKVYSVDRKYLSKHGKVKMVPQGAEQAIDIVDVGSAIPGVDVRVVSDKDRPIGEGKIGHVQIRGKNVTSGYYNNDEANRQAFINGWLRTGDLGFIWQSRLCITGRSKDIIFCNGQNYFAYDLEACTESAEHAMPGKVAACGWTDSESQKEKVAIFVAIKRSRANSITQNKVLQSIGEHVNEAMGFSPDYIVPVQTIPKTSSGKIQRYKLLDDLLGGLYDDVAYHYRRSVEEHEVTNNTELSGLSVVEKVLKIWSNVLARDVTKIDLDKSFLKQGGSSIKAVKVMDELECAFELELGHEILLHCETVNKMVSYVEERLQDSKASSQADATPQSSRNNEAAVDDIAIIAMACRFPGANSPEEFWHHLRHGHDLVDEIPLSRWKSSGLYDLSNDKEGGISSRWGGFLEDPFNFDADFFAIDQNEALSMDPQQRLVLELCWEALERAGYSTKLNSITNTGVFIGASFNNYMETFLQSLTLSELDRFDTIKKLSPELRKELFDEWRARFGDSTIETYTVVDNLLNMIASRASQELNLKGPSLTIDTACSSSLVSLHMACESIHRGECEAALAGGINLLLTPTPYQLFSKSGALSKRGKCRVFDATADGFVPGEGGGIVMLKPLKKAQQDGDLIHGVIKGAWINNDGRSIGVMSPNPDGQKSVITEVYDRFNLSPNDIGYLEAHGTGTVIGDHSEVRALRQAFNQFSDKRGYCALGSVKANIGHLLSAAGIASFIKVIMAMKHRQLPPSINLEETNASLSLEKSPFYLVRELQEWHALEGKSRQAAINSFGFGGTNCHMVVEEASNTPCPQALESLSRQALVCLSGMDSQAIARQATSLANYLRKHPNAKLEDIAYTVNATRKHHSHRKAISTSSIEALVADLKKLAEHVSQPTTPPQVVCMFTGQGSQYPGMAQTLYDNNEVFKNNLDKVLGLIEKSSSLPIRELMLSDKADSDMLTSTAASQPAIFAMDYAMAQVVLSWGIKPDYVLGHSLGEYVAAVVSGVFLLEDAVKLVVARGALMAELPAEGGMRAIFTDEEQVSAVVSQYPGRLSVAAYNGSHVVVSGELAALEEISQHFQARAAVVKELTVSHAFHSPLMMPMMEKFAHELDQVTFAPQQITMVSNVYGKADAQYLYDKEYWLSHIIEPVHFSSSLARIIGSEPTILLELGPKPILTGLARTITASNENVTVIASAAVGGDSSLMLDQAITTLYEQGVAFDWQHAYTHSNGSLINLPSYQFQKSNFRLLGNASGSGSSSGTIEATAKGIYNIPAWIESSLSSPAAFPEGPILIFTDKQGNYKSLLTRVKQHNSSIITVSCAESFSALSNTSYKINPEHEDDYHQLFTALRDKVGLPATIIHMGLSDSLPLDDAELYNRRDNLHEVLNSLLCFIHAWGEYVNGSHNSTTLTLVTHSEPVPTGSGDISLAPLSRMITSWLGAACHELDMLKFQQLEVTGSYNSSQLAKVILSICIANECNHQWLLHGEQLYRQQWRQDHTFTTDNQAQDIEPGDTVLITGGATGIGYLIAESLVKRNAINLVITGRQAIPERDLWHESASPRVANLQKLEELGATVSYYAADICDQNEMESILQKVRAQFGHISGVIHAAGVVDNRNLLVKQKSNETIAAVLAPKIKGTIILDQLTRNEELKFFICLSSISSSQWRLGAGLSDYSAANAFLDGYADFRHSCGGKGRSITLNWPLWKGYGMAANDWVTAAVEQRGASAISAHHGIRLFNKLLTSGATGVYYITGDIKARTNLPNKPKDPVIAHLPGNTNKQEVVLGMIRQLISYRNGVPAHQIRVNQNFTELGIDSSAAIDLISELSKELGQTLYPTLLFEHQTPQALAKHITKNLLLDNLPGVEGSTQNTTQQQETESANDSNPTAIDDKYNDSDIAIIGMACRVPDAEDTEQFWSNISKGKSSIREVPQERWSTDDYFSTESPSKSKSYSKWGGFIDAPYSFDPLLFGISPREAEAMDPQQRIFLEVAFSALQNAGHMGSEATKNIGVFVGCEHNNYAERVFSFQHIEALRQKLSDPEVFSKLPAKEREQLFKLLADTLKPGEINADAVAGNGMNIIAARISQCLNLTGPALAVNTACSSSLVALHLACESVRQNESEVAIAGGVCLNLSATPYVLLSQVQALSPNGNCAPFDEAANGMVLGEGAGVVIIKPLKKAMRDGDTILAVIKGSAINNDGQSNGITAPKPDGQAGAIKAAYKRANISPDSISHIECHGTATKLGDPVEIEGMTQAFRTFTDKQQYCSIGSTKSSIGHLLSASGVISLIKVIKMMEHKVLPTTVGYNKPNPYINFQASPFYIKASTQPWKGINGIRRAGINAFGFGGTNCHLIIEEPPAIDRTPNVANAPALICLSARNKVSLRQNAQRLLGYVKRNDNIDLNDIAYSLTTGQRHLKLRSAAVIADSDELTRYLESVAKGDGIEQQATIEEGGADVVLKFTQRNESTGMAICAFKAEFPWLSDSIEQWRLEWQKRPISLVGKTEAKREGLELNYVLGRLILALSNTPFSVTGKGEWQAVTELLNDAETADQGTQAKPTLTFATCENTNNSGVTIVEELLQALNTLYCYGADVDFATLLHDAQRLTLPPYAFDQKSYQTNYDKVLYEETRDLSPPIVLTKPINDLIHLDDLATLSQSQKQSTVSRLSEELNRWKQF